MEKIKGLEDVFIKLALKKDSIIRLPDDNWKRKVRFPSRMYRLLDNNIKPDAFFCFDNKPLILFFENPKNKEDLHKSIWNFNESPIVIILEKGVVEIFNGFKFLDKRKSLAKIGDQDKLDDFNYFKLVTGKTWEEYQKYLSHRNRVDYKLLLNIRDARKLILAEFPKIVDNKLKIKLTNALLGKIIFVRYLIDKKVKINFDGKSREWTNDEFCKLLDKPQKIKQFFDCLADSNKGFNGDLFSIEDNDYKQIPTTKVYPIIKRLLKSEDIKRRQPSLFDLYDFSIIPIEFISNIYESFIGEENQAKEGAYYTPLFLVDYILSETIEKQLAKTKGTNCKVLDPACGSGIFLVETLRKLIEQYSSNNPTQKPNSKQFKSAIKKIVKDNIFGIDKDESAVQVAIFSVYLTLLDYLNPPEIETFKFPTLLNENFFCADFFDESSDLNKFKEKDFSFILGNPPWMRGKNEKKTPSYIKYINNRREKENKKDEPIIGNKEIAQAFLLRSSDFSKAKTKCALIVTSKVLYNLQSKNFRKYFLQNYQIERVFELASVRREVFDKSNDKATAPACVLFFNYTNGKNTDKNLIEHIALKPSRFFTMFKIFTINRHDIQTVQQDKLKEYDWLWKVLVYGSYLDFNFIRRFKEITSIQESFKENTLIKQGIKRVDGNKKIDVTSLKNWDFLDLNEKEIQQFHINVQHNKWKLKEVGYIYRENGKICEDVFTPPMLLIKETVNTRLESVSAISHKKILFTDKITSIKFRDDKNIDEYYLIAGLINSTLFAYYMLNTSSTAGIMIEQQINDIERFSFPYIYSNDIVVYAKEIESLKSNALIDEYKIKELLDKIDQSIYKSLSLNEIERALIDYSKNVAIPMIMKHENYEKLFLPCELNDTILTDYANIFIGRFKSSFVPAGKKFVVEIWYTQQVIGMFFNVISEAEYKQDIIWKDKQKDISGLFQKIIKLGTRKITDKLFIRKDIRGFEETSFYIFKPNEECLWHKAVGYLDVYEFSDAILKAGRDRK